MICACWRHRGNYLSPVIFSSILSIWQLAKYSRYRGDELILRGFIIYSSVLQLVGPTNNSTKINHFYFNWIFVKVNCTNIPSVPGYLSPELLHEESWSRWSSIQDCDQFGQNALGESHRKQTICWMSGFWDWESP